MNNRNQQPLTKDELTYAFKEERGELVKLIKQEISLHIGEKIDKMAGQIGSIQTHQLQQDIRMDKMEERFIRKSTEDKNEILNSNDKLMAELKKKNEEGAAHSLSHIQIKNNLANHERRLQALEPQSA